MIGCIEQQLVIIWFHIYMYAPFELINKVFLKLKIMELVFLDNLLDFID
jgi:hypothetical protein